VADGFSNLTGRQTQEDSMFTSRSVRRAAGIIVAIVMGIGNHAYAQSGGPLVASLVRVAQDRLGSVVAAAEQMPEAHYGFRPTEDTRRFGELVAHVADTNRAFCSAIGGRREPVGFEIEKTVHAKAALVPQLKESIEACRTALGTLTDAALPAPLAFGGGALVDGTEIPISKLPAGMLVTLLAGHTEREYGKLTIYLRLKGLVPPTSQPRTR
jgi:hypothetical protein